MVPTHLKSIMDDGTEISWARQGSGDPVVMVHGITESSESWGTVPELLAADFEVITIDLRGHGRSTSATDYSLVAMAGDVGSVIASSGVDRPHLVGHSLGGAVVSAVGAMVPVASVVNIDQQLKLGDFKSQLEAFESMLRDPDMFRTVMVGLFDGMVGPLNEAEKARLVGIRRIDQEVVLGAWQMIFEQSTDEIDAAVDLILAGYGASEVPYLSLFGSDPGPTYESWLADRVAGSSVEVWADHGHYPHLVDQSRFIERVRAFWAAASN